MRLYTREQVALRISLAILGTAIAVSTFFLVWGGDHLGSPGAAFEPVSIDTAVSEDLIPVQDGSVYNDDERENIDIYQRLNSGVVNITTETLALNWFFEPVPQQGGTGSGSIIDERGYVLTNYHVVENAYKVFITLANGDRFEGEVVGRDPETDLAIVRFDPGRISLTTIPFGTSEDLKVGQKVLAIGNPFAFERTLTTGIISGLGRPVRGSQNFVIQGMIQTDASINPGNSGGPLLNSHGQLIGVNTMIYSPTGGSVGIGFATPVDTARRVIPDLIEYGSVKRGWIDITRVPIEPSISRYVGLNSGLIVSQVARNSNASRAGIRGGTREGQVRYGRDIVYLDGDIITAINGEPVATNSDFYGALEQTKPGDEVRLTIYRDGKTLEFTLVLSERPQNPYGN